MLARKWRKFLIRTDVIPSDTPLFPLRFLFLLAVCTSIIFYRFVYIYIYNTPLSKYLYDYKISYDSKIYIEGFFISTWIIFITVFLFRISDFLLEYIIIPIWKILSLAFFRLLYALNIITKKTFIIFKNKNKFFTNTSKTSKIKDRLKTNISKTKNNERRSKKHSTSLHWSQGKIKKKTS